MRYDFDRAANFSNYKTYAWTRGTELTDELNHGRIVRAIDRALVAKGFARVEPTADPDVLVAYHASFEKRLEITGWAHGWGPFGLGEVGWGRRGFSRFWSARLSSTSPTPGRPRLVWRSLASSDIRPTDKPETREKKITNATEKMFKDYPPQSR